MQFDWHAVSQHGRGAGHSLDTTERSLNRCRIARLCVLARRIGTCQHLDGITCEARTFGSREAQASLAPKVVQDDSGFVMPYKQEIGSGSPEICGEKEILVGKKDRGSGVSTT